MLPRACGSWYCLCDQAFSATGEPALKGMDFLRALVVDPITFWAPGGNCMATEAEFFCLLDDDLTYDKLAEVVDLEDVKELRLLPEAVAFLWPAHSGEPGSRQPLSELLLADVETREGYDDFVATAQAEKDDESMCTGSVISDQDEDSDEEIFTKQAMALAHPDHAFTPKHDEDTWLIPPATTAAYAEAYGLHAGHLGTTLRTGVWAPGLPLL